MIGGATCKILRINLSDKKVSVETYPEEYVSKYLGGDGLAARFLYDELPPSTDALDPDNPLVLLAGPLVGTKLQGSCNTAVVAKSPLTGFTLYNSHVNGWFAHRLKYNGYDAVFIKGKSGYPVYLWLHDGIAEIKDASSLWGRDTFDATDTIRKELAQPKVSCMCIGPAGENLVLISCMVVDKHQVVARGGLGAVMGAKNLKAIAVYASGKEIPIADPKRFQKAAHDFRELCSRRMAEYGSASGWAKYYEIGDIPIKNWSSGTIEGWEKLSGQNVVSKFLKRHTSCPTCAVAHTKLLEVKEGEFKGIYDCPEYEMLVSMGTNIGVTDPIAAIKGSDLLDRYGLDGLGTSNVIGLTMECIEKGLLTREEIGGLDLTFGNYRAAWEMIDKISKREGFGNILANGPVRAANHIGNGADKLVLHVKGMPIVMHDHRSIWGSGLSQAIGSAGPQHEGAPLQAETHGTIPRLSMNGKAEIVKQGQLLYCIKNSTGICHFGSIGVPLEMYAEVLSAVIGIDFTVETLNMIALRHLNLRRGFNVRNGLVPEDDTLPYRYTHDPLPDGGSKGAIIPIKPMVRDYYKLMGWDHKTGKPFRKTLLDLDLGEVAEDLWGAQCK